MRPDTHVTINGRQVGFQEGCGEYLMLIRELRSGRLRADNKQAFWEWVAIGIEWAFGLLFFGGGVFAILAAMGYIPDRESGWLNIGVPGIVAVIIGGFLLLSALGSSLGYTQLIIDGKTVKLNEILLGRRKTVKEATLGPDDQLVCHYREDAEQDIFAVSAELELPSVETSVTLFLSGVATNLKPGEALRETRSTGFQESARKAFDKAEEIGKCLDIKICC